VNLILSSDQNSKQPIHVKVEVLGYLRAITGKKEVDVELKGKNTIDELVQTLSGHYGRAMTDAMVAPTSGEFMVLILVNGKDIDFLEKSKTLVSDGDVVTIIPMTAGG